MCCVNTLAVVVCNDVVFLALLTRFSVVVLLAIAVSSVGMLKGMSTLVRMDLHSEIVIEFFVDLSTSGIEIRLHWK